METIEDFVRWIVDSMGLTLSDVTIQMLTLDLLNNDKYIEALMELEDNIIKHSKEDVTHRRSIIHRIK